jgi:hypothetical protein
MHSVLVSFNVRHSVEFDWARLEKREPRPIFTRRIMSFSCMEARISVGGSGGHSPALPHRRIFQVI